MPVVAQGSASRTQRLIVVMALGAAVAAALFLGNGADRVSSGPASGRAMNDVSRSQPTSARTLRIGTWNIHSGVGRDGRYDLQRIAKCLDGLDFVALNEVRGLAAGSANNQAAALGATLQQAWLFAPSERQWWHDHFGNAALTDLPISAWLRIPLPCSQGKGYRNALLMTVETAGAPVRVLATHLDRSHDRAMQLAAVSDLFLALAEPCVLLGDLNTTSDDAQIQRLRCAPGVEDPFAARLGGNDEFRIDWILTRGLHCVRCDIEDRGASDHPLLWAELKISEPYPLSPRHATRAKPDRVR